MGIHWKYEKGREQMFRFFSAQSSGRNEKVWKAFVDFSVESGGNHSFCPCFLAFLGPLGVTWMIRSSFILSCVVLGFTFVICGTVSAEEGATQYTVARIFGKNKTYAYDENSVEHGVVLLDFYNDACGPCRSMMPYVSQLVQKGYRISKVNTDQFPDWAQRFNITKIPCFVVIVDGKEVARHTGTTTRQNLESMIVSAGGSPVMTHPEPANSGREVLVQQQSAPSAWRGREQNVAVLDIMEGRYTFSPTFEASTANQAIASNVGNLPEGAKGAESGGFAGNAESAASGRFVRTAEETQTVADALRSGGSAGSEALDSSALAQHALASTVRIYVHNQNGQEGTGSGTLVDCRSGHALILTCGHLFREYKSGDTITVNVFTSAGMRTIPAKYVSHDLERDLGLLSITIQEPVETAPVVASDFRLFNGMSICTSGCSKGANPTVQKGVITAQNRYIGSPNIETSALPVEGRSGGGMFTADGRLLGVCMAADPEYQEGMFSSYEAIHAYFASLKMQDFVLSPRNESQKSLQNPVSKPEEEATLLLADLPAQASSTENKVVSSAPSFVPVLPQESVPETLEPTVLKEAVPQEQTLSNAEPVAPIEPAAPIGLNPEPSLTGENTPAWPPHW